MKTNFNARAAATTPIKADMGVKDAAKFIKDAFAKHGLKVTTEFEEDEDTDDFIDVRLTNPVNKNIIHMNFELGYSGEVTISTDTYGFDFGNLDMDEFMYTPDLQKGKKKSKDVQRWLTSVSTNADKGIERMKAWKEFTTSFASAITDLQKAVDKNKSSGPAKREQIEEYVGPAHSPARGGRGLGPNGPMRGPSRKGGGPWAR